MKPSDEVAITDFCHCHRGQSGRRWRGGVEGISPLRASLTRCVTLDGGVAKLLSEATGKCELDYRVTV